jgi:hypothetical protein
MDLLNSPLYMKTCCPFGLKKDHILVTTIRGMVPFSAFLLIEKMAIILNKMEPLCYTYTKDMK